ncbi:ROK family protein [Nonomuraea sp. NPDC050556]|uniref:ROK family transcriptional regulator n=1 Tax=Nonomuraea sp. NPDC050556 TaxID=3364369 RepID=UPI0037AA48DA
MTNKVPATAQDLRAHNRGLVLRLLRDEGPLPRAELARRTGLSATTMTKVVAQLIEEGNLAERSVTDSPEPRIGRPATDVALVPGSAWVVGVQVGVGAVQIGLCDLLGRAGWTSGFEFAADAPVDPMLDRLAGAIDELVKESGVERVLGIGVAAPGPVDPDHRVNLLSVNAGWHDVRFADLLEGALGLATVVDHNVRAMALAEARYGCRERNLLYVHVRTGLGAGVVLNGRPFQPGVYGVTELGHLRVVERGRKCACGSTGCLETVVSEPYLAAKVGAPIMAALDDHPEVRDELVDYLSTGLAAAVNLLNPEHIRLGGIFCDAPDALLDRIRGALRDKTFPVLRDSVHLDRSSLGMDAGVAGGAAVALDRFFYL